ncbi:serine/threonine protein kinase [Anabaena sp. WFMT]|uniref:serine/threonine protein kinase n=1 Tax=Anabaena sp. WFMT TaxID=3449730 RepID=UPI003F1FB15B
MKKVIGGGGFGETYLAEDTEENRLVVIKTLNREQREKPDFAERQKKFRKEALDLSKCYHPHIVQVYDNFPEDGLWAIVMEHIDGDDLAAYVESYTAENGYLSETEALRYIDQIGQALESEVLNVKILSILPKLCIGIGDTKFEKLMTLFSINRQFGLG